jgi:hypothetical protein
MGTVKKRRHGKRHLQNSGTIMTSRTLLLLAIAGGIGMLYIHTPRTTEAILVAMTVLAMLAKLIS